MIKKVILGLCIISWVVLTVFLWNFNSTQDTSFGGELIFGTQGEYTEFKEGLKNRILDKEIELKEFTVLASEPPIIVKFKVVVPHDYELPYGERNPNYSVVVVFSTVFMSFAAGLLLVVVPCAIIFSKKEG